MSNLKILDLKQGTDEWHKWRMNKASASRAPAIMGASPAWGPQNWDELRLQDAGLDPEANEFTKKAWEHGKTYEPVAAEELIKLYGMDPIDGGCCESVSDPRFTVSYDVLDEGLGSFIEIKCPVSRERSLLYKAIVKHSYDINKGLIHARTVLPGYIWWQLVHQAGMLRSEVTGGRAVLAVYIPGQGSRSCRIHYKQLWADWDNLKVCWEAYLENRSQYGNTIDVLAAVWANKKRALSLAGNAEKSAKEALIESVSKSNSIDEYKGRYASVKKQSRKGTVNWKGVAKDIAEDAGFGFENCGDFINDNTGPDSDSWVCRERNPK